MAVQGASLQPIYNRLNAVEEENPGNAVTFSDWSMQAGDTVTIVRDGKEYKSTVHSSTMVWKGKTPTVTINNNSSERRVAIATDSKRKFSRGGSNLRASENAYWDMVTSYNNMTSGLILASSSAALYVENMYTQMKSGLELTSSTATLYVDNKYSQMSSGLKLTSSSAALYVDNKYSQMSSGLMLTSSSAALYVDNKYTQMSSGLELTSSSAALYVDNKYSQMSSGLELTSSSAALYVDNKYSQMRSGLDLTSSSATLYAGSAENAASIVAKINESTGQSEIKIDANRVYIGSSKSTTVINGKLNTSELNATNIKSIIGQIAVVEAQTIEATSLKFSSTGTSSGPYTSVRELIDAYKIVKTGNNYKLQYKRLNSTTWYDAPDSETFSRAVSSWTLAGGDGQVKVTANPQDQTYGVDVQVNGDESITTNGTYTYEVECYDDDAEEWLHTEATLEVTVNVPSTTLNPEAEYTDYGSTEPTGVSGMGDLGTTTPSNVQNWYVITAKDGTESKPYKLKLDGSSIYDDSSHDLYIGKSDNRPASSSINLGRNESYTVWPCVHKYGHTGYDNSDIMWGSGVTFHGPSGTAITMTRGAYDDRSHTYTCTCTLGENVATSSSFTLYYMQ